jgi:Cytochrome c7 and related cytochrome c
MPQIFHPSMNTISRLTIFGAVFVISALGWLLLTVVRSPYVTNVGVVKEQPVPFSHKHHVSEAGIDCRYCHTSVESSSFAGIPPTQTCMNCHSQIWSQSPMLEPVRASFRDGKPLEWNRVHDLPDYVYFDHSIHVAKGVACTTCHGEVDQMPLMYRAASLHMEWCLGCHRHPDEHIGPRDAVFATSAQLAQMSISESRARLAADYHVQSKTNCSICHR